MDFASVDYYPSTDVQNDSKAQIYHGALTLDLTRGVKQRNFWVMEQLSGTPGCWYPMARTPHPGMVRAHAWQSVSRGADAVVHFRWRSARIGAEQFWHGLLDHHGKPGRRFAEFAQFSEEVRRLSPLLDGTTRVNDVAMLFSHEQLNALRIQPQSDGFDYLANFKQLHRALLGLGIGTDVINWRADIKRYKLVLAPYLFLLDEELAATLRDYAAAGGTVILTTRSGVKNMNNVCQPEMLPGLLSGLAGTVVEEYDPVGRDRQGVHFGAQGEFGCAQWCDILAPTGAATLATYTSDFFAGRAALTRNSYGAGAVYYIGTVLEDRAYTSLFLRIATDLGIECTPGLPGGVELSVRTGKDGRIVFVLNLTKEPKQVDLQERDYVSALSGARYRCRIDLAPMGIEVLLEQ